MANARTTPICPGAALDATRMPNGSFTTSPLKSSAHIPEDAAHVMAEESRSTARGSRLTKESELLFRE